MRLRPSLTVIVPLAMLSSMAMMGVGLAGCGGSSSQSNGVAAKTPAEILTASKEAAHEASSVHVSGAIVSSSTQIALDITLLAHARAKGSLSQNGASFQLIQTGGFVYLKGSPDFYRRIAGPAAAELLQGKWLKAPIGDPNFNQLSSLLDLTKLIDTTLSDHSAITKGATTTVAQREVIPITDTAKGGTLYIAATGKPYPIEILKRGSGGGKVLFDRWNAPASVTPPPNAIDITKLQPPR